MSGVCQERDPTWHPLVLSWLSQPATSLSIWLLHGLPHQARILDVVTKLFLSAYPLWLWIRSCQKKLVYWLLWWSFVWRNTPALLNLVCWCELVSLRLFGVGHSDWSVTNFITRLVCGESTVATLSWCIVVCEVALRWTKRFGFSGWCIFTWQWFSCHTDRNVSFYAFVTNRLVWWILHFLCLAITSTFCSLCFHNGWWNGLWGW